MLNRTKGYLLLILLVVTGLASQVSNNTISSKERRYLTHHLKQTRTDFLQSVKGLSDAQLHFKPAPDQWSVLECIQHITLAEAKLKALAEATLKECPNQQMDKIALRSDAEILQRVHEWEQKTKSSDLPPAHSPWKTGEETLDAFKENHNALIKFTRTTTDDIRKCVAEAPFGRADVYQLLLSISAHTARHTRQIEEIKAHSSFPKQ